MQTPRATPVSVIATTDLERLHIQIALQHAALARQAELIAGLMAAHVALQLRFNPTNPEGGRPI